MSDRMDYPFVGSTDESEVYPMREDVPAELWGKRIEKKMSRKKWKNKVEEYKSKINYDVWADVSNVKYNIEVNYNVQSQTSDTTDSGNRDNKS
jgi:hypothetical protein|tara:strand:- start:2021 stop:2299 length:279 start_codon:yes stop_codon:yes gene_type:complete